MANDREWAPSRIYDECVAAATKAYYEWYMRQLSADEAMAEMKNGMTVEFWHAPAKRLSVTITILGGWKYPNEVYFWRWRAVSGGCYKLVGGTLDL